MSQFVNIGLLFCFVTLAVSGVLSFVAAFSIVVARIHIIFGMLTLVFVGLHLWTKAKPLKRQLKNIRYLGGAFLLWLFFLVAAWENWLVTRLVIDQGYESKHRREIVRPHPLVANLQDNDQMTLSRQMNGKTAVSLHIALNDLQKFPAMAIWAESKNGTIIETMFLNQELAFSDNPQWEGQKTPRKKILPVWRHRYTTISGLSPDGEIDATSGATENHRFSLDDHLSTDGEPFTLFIEVNAAGDVDDNWPDQHLGQPSVLYSAYIEPATAGRYSLLELTGQGGGAEEDGAVNYDVETIGSAKNILDLGLIEIRLPKSQKP